MSYVPVPWHPLANHEIDGITLKDHPTLTIVNSASQARTLPRAAVEPTRH
jgi:hypothetical protein